MSNLNQIEHILSQLNNNFDKPAISCKQNYKCKKGSNSATGSNC